VSVDWRVRPFGLPVHWPLQTAAALLDRIRVQRQIGDVSVYRRGSLIDVLDSTDDPLQGPQLIPGSETQRCA
jgi:hypothetical protein